LVASVDIGFGGRPWRAPFVFAEPSGAGVTVGRANVVDHHDYAMPDELTPERELVEEHRTITRTVADVAIVATPFAIVAAPVAAAWANEHFGQGGESGGTTVNNITNVTVNEAPPAQESEE
jgi:hypothetical protein